MERPHCTGHNRIHVLRRTRPIVYANGLRSAEDNSTAVWVSETEKCGPALLHYCMWNSLEWLLVGHLCSARLFDCDGLHNDTHC